MLLFENCPETVKIDHTLNENEMKETRRENGDDIMTIIL
jgi:hypothetical protein